MVVKSIQNNSVENRQIYKPQFKGAETSSQTPNTDGFAQKLLTPQNIILGSLASLGVLGMADIFLCKGRHLEKISGRHTGLEEAVAKAKAAETKLSATETKLQNTEFKLDKTEQKLKELQDDLQKIQQEKEQLVNDSTGKSVWELHCESMLIRFQKLYTECQDFGPEAEKYTKKVLRQTLKHIGMDFLEVTPNHPRFSELCTLEPAGIKNFHLNSVPIVYLSDGRVVLKGHCYVPMTK